MSSESRVLRLALVLSLALGLLVVPSVLDPAPSPAAADSSPSLDAGESHACAVLIGGAVECWGSNSQGQLGNGSSGGYTATPVRVTGLSGAVAVGAGRSHTCAVRSSGTVHCWGNGSDGKLGNGVDGSSNTPVQVSGLSNAVDVVAGYDHSCALAADATVWCWGEGDSNYIGDGDPSTADRLVPSQVVGLADAVELSAFSEHTCAVRATGAVVCWGYNGDGQLGDGTSTSSNVPVEAVGISGAVDVTAGETHSCALLSTGGVRCWGGGSGGRLGHGSNSSSSTPVAVTGITTARTISASYDHTCVVLADATVRCWGENRQGELGNGETDDSNVPVQMAGVTNALHVAAGSQFTCVLLSGGAVRCVGTSSLGQSGTAAIGSYTTPQAVAGLSAVVEVGVGDEHACALDASGDVWCWGDSFWGQLGHGGSSGGAPGKVTGLPSIAEIAVGHQHSCARTTGGAVWCWGRGSFGRLGNGSSASQPTPVQVSGITAGATSITAGGSHSCAVVAGEVRCWGDAFWRQLGDGTTTSSASTPVTVVDIGDTEPDARQVSAGARHTCAVLVDGTARCWGYASDGALGHGSLIGDSNVPVVVSSLTTVDSVAAGGRHSCAVLSDSSLRCWGRRTNGLLGDGSTNPTSSTPVTVTAPNGATQVATGGDSFNAHSCARWATGTVRCWGWNGWGQLGIGTTTTSSVPAEVSGIDAQMVAAGVATTCAALVGGTVACWGSNSEGQVGLGVPRALTPQTIALSGPAGSTESPLLPLQPGGPSPSDPDDGGDGDDGDDGGEADDGGSEEPTGARVLVPAGPGRLVDTRGSGRPGAGGVVEVPVAGRFGVPSDARAIVANLTVTGAEAAGFATVFSCGSVPGTSSINYQVGASIANEVIVELSDDGSVCVYTHHSADVILDASAYVPDGSGLVSTGPGRLVDTRVSGRPGAGGVVEIPVVGRFGVPGDAESIVANLTVTGAEAAGFATVFSCGSVPATSSINYQVGGSIANEVVVELSDNGSVCVYTHRSADVILDVSAAIPADAGYEPAGPGRLVDTRTADRPGAGAIVEVPVVGRFGVTSETELVVANLTVTGAEAAGFATVFSCGSVPGTSSINYQVGASIANEVIVELSDDGSVCVYTHRSADVILDLVGTA